MGEKRDRIYEVDIELENFQRIKTQIVTVVAAVVSK